MTWEELKEEAKKMGAIIEDDCSIRDVVIFLGGIGYTHKGHIITWSQYSAEFISLAHNRTPDQMLAIMKALQ